MSITGKTAVTPPGPSGPVPRKPWHKRRWVRITGVIIGLAVIIALSNHSGTSPAAATAPARSATPRAQAPKATPKPPKTAAPAAPAGPAQVSASPAQVSAGPAQVSASPAQTTPAAAVPAQPSSPAPAQSTQPAAPPAAAAPAGCYPLSNAGTCYEPGEYCRNADHGVSGMAGDGEAITCEDNNGWRWEPA